MSSLASRQLTSRIALDTYLAGKFRYVERTQADMHAYQDQAVKFLLDHRFAALFIDTGLGKTVIVLTLLTILYMQEKFKKALIVAPIRVAAHGWPNEIAAWQHTAFLRHSVIRAEDDDDEVLLAGKCAYEDAREWLATPAEAQAASGKAKTLKKEELRKQRAEDNCAIHLIDHHHLEWLIDQYSEWVVVKKGTKPRRKIVGWPYDIVVIDESSSYGAVGNARFRALAQVRLQGFVDRLIELTATPAADTYMKLFSQIFLLDKGKRLGRFITHYRRKFFDYNDYSKTYKLKEGADEAISALIADICLVMKSADYLEEKEPLFLPRRIDLTEFQLAQYQKFERDFILTLADGERIEAVTAAALSGKLLQFASGAVYRDLRDVLDEPENAEKKHPWSQIHNHKIEDLQELVEELDGSPILVAYWYKSSLERLRKAFPDAAVMDKAGKVASRHGPWNSGKIKMLLVHPASVGHGLNMQYGPGHDLYMFDMCWSYELFYQLYRRLHRQGQKLQVRIHLPMVRGTVDMLVWARLKMKEDAQEVLFNWIRKLRKQMTMRKAA